MGEENNSILVATNCFHPNLLFPFPQTCSSVWGKDGMGVYASISFLTTSAHSLDRDERSTFFSPIMIRCKTLPNSRISAGTLESAAIFRFHKRHGRFPQNRDRQTPFPFGEV